MTADLDARLFDVDEYAPLQTVSLRDRFVVPPFTVLDTRQGYWQSRKREWLALGIQSELGRGEGMTYHTDYMFEKGGRYDSRAGKRLTYGEMEWDGYRAAEKAKATAEAAAAVDTSRKAADERSNVTGAGALPEYANNGMANIAPGTSIFDPVLCELAYRWHTPDDGAHVLDPFAGGSVRGIVASVLNRTYTGVDLRAEQVEANRTQVDPVLGPYPDAPRPTWVTGDSRDIDLHAGDRLYDLVFSCPPYADLEVYSDDPADLSTMTYPDFLAAYRTIIARSVELLRDDRFVVWVVGEARDTRAPGSPSYGFVADTVNAFRDAGCVLYNEAILVNMVGTLALRITKQFNASRKIGRCHQHVLVFAKGNPRAAADYAGSEGDDE